MKAYVVTTGTVFAVLTLAHLVRIALENPQLARAPDFVAITLVSAALAFWAWRVWRRLPR